MRYWTVAEAREHLPRLRELLGVIRHAARAHTGKIPSENGDRSPMVDAQEAFDELQAGDIVLRDAHTGLVDFHSRGADDVVYFLCWRLDDDDLAWWHLPTEGYPARKPLPREPA